MGLTPIRSFVTGFGNDPNLMTALNSSDLPGPSGPITKMKLGSKALMCSGSG
jgi:hypothetical protein